MLANADLYITAHKQAFKPYTNSAAKIFWLSEDIYKMRRAICKRPCMTYFYSCQPKTMAKSLFKDFRTDPKFSKLQISFCYWLCYRIYMMCRETMPKATKAMDTFIELGKADYYKGKDFEFIAPYNEFLLQQNYRNPIIKRVKVKYKRSFIKLGVMTGVGDRLDYKKIINANSPNIVHCLDSQIVSSVMMHTEYDVSPIHDSFGAVTANAGKLYEDIRECFVYIFDEDLWDDIMAQKGYIHDVELGDLNIDDIYDDEYFAI